ncbi:MAG: DUF695 domain-containing protein [Pirellulales bacterium]|nr:DUF695 domain-containing protein [Pirellulales bacterium]
MLARVGEERGMAEAWNSYITRRNEQVAVILVNHGIGDEVPDPQRPWLLRANVSWQHSGEGELPDRNEMETIYGLEDDICQIIEERMDATMVGRILRSGRSEMYFYAAEPGPFEQVVHQALAKHPGYHCECFAAADPGWTHYFDELYPGPEEMQQIQNQLVVMELTKHGDRLQVPRPVTHYLHFPTSYTRESFAAEAGQIGFKVADQFEEEDDEDSSELLPFWIVIERTDAVQLDVITAVTIELMRLADEHGGRYDGWETPLVCDES